MGGLNAEPQLNATGPLELFALENVKNIKKIMSNKIAESEDKEKFLKTMKFLGYLCEENDV